MIVKTHENGDEKEKGIAKLLSLCYYSNITGNVTGNHTGNITENQAKGGEE